MYLSKKTRISRRSLMRRAIVAAGGIASAPYVLTSTALGADGRPPASDRIVVGGIGVGRRGSSDLRWMMGEKDVQFVFVSQSGRTKENGLYCRHLSMLGGWRSTRKQRFSATGQQEYHRFSYRYRIQFGVPGNPSPPRSPRVFQFDAQQILK